MKILFISSFLLFPKTRFGGTKRLYLLAQELAARHELYLIHTDGCSEQEHFAENGGSPFGRSLFVPIDHRVTHSAVDRLWRPFFDFRKEDYSGLVDRFVGEVSFDAVFVAYPLALSLIDRFRSHPNLTYLEDDLLFEQIRCEAQEEQMQPTTRLMKRFSYWKSMRYYRRQLRNARNFVTISPEEDRIVSQQFPHLQRHIIGYGIDQNQYPVLDFPAKLQTLGYIGNFSHTPNLTALDHFMTAIYPAIKSRIPGTEFYVAGPGLPPDRISKYSSDSVHILGAVDDIREFYARFSVFVNPITTGRGLRTKLIEAVAFGRPVISTHLGAEGLSDLNIEMAETGEECAAVLQRYWGNPEFMESVVRGNRAVFETRYTQSAVALKLEAVLRR